MADFNSIKHGLKQFDVLMSDDAFTQAIKQFQKEAENKLNQVETLQIKTEESYQKVVCFYGENVKGIQPDEFFKIFYTFTSSWQVRCIHNHSYEQNTNNMSNRNVQVI